MYRVIDCIVHVAAAMLPQGIIGLIVGGLAQAIPGILGKPRITIGVGATLIIIAEILQVYSDGGRGMNVSAFLNDMPDHICLA